MPLSIGIPEIAVLAVTAIVVGWLARRTSRTWLLGVVAMAVVAMVASPADPVSMLLIAVPCCTIYVAALLRMEKQLQAGA